MQLALYPDAIQQTQYAPPWDGAILAEHKTVTSTVSASPKITAAHDKRMEKRTKRLFPACKKSTPEILDDGSAIYVADEGGRFYLQIFAGMAINHAPRICGYYRDKLARDKRIADFKKERAEIAEQKSQQREQAKNQNFKVGDILCAQYIYSMTLVEYYEVVAVNGSMITIQEIRATTKITGRMVGHKTPCPGEFIGAPLRRRPNTYGYVRINSSGAAKIWDGEPKEIDFDD